MGLFNGGFHCSLSLLVIIFTVSCAAQLTRDEKQEILDRHNYYRASVDAAGMRRLVRGNKLAAETRNR